MNKVSRRMGFVPIPITIMLIRVVGQSVNLNERTTWAVLSNFSIIKNSIIKKNCKIADWNI